MPKSKRQSKIESNIEIIARGVIAHEGRVLLCRNAKKGYFYLPGGHVEPGESSAEALDREIDEELGWSVQAGACLLAAECRFHDGDQDRHEINLVFHVEHPHAHTDAPESQEDDIAFRWAEHAELADLDIRPSVIKAWLASGDAERATPDQPKWISITE